MPAPPRESPPGVRLSETWYKYSNANFSALGASNTSSTANGGIPTGGSAGGNPFASIGSTSGSSMIASSGGGSNPFAQGGSF